MLQLTPRATAHLQRVRRRRGIDDDQMPRLVGKATQVGLTFTRSPEPGDQRIDSDEVSVLLASDVATRLGDAVMDVRSENGSDVLVVRPVGSGK